MRSARTARRTRSAALAAGLTGALALALPGAAVAHDLDHPVPGFSEAAPLAAGVLSGGEGAQWEPIASIPTGNPHTDLDFFTSGGETYASVGTLGVGANAGGQSIIQLTTTDEEGVQTVAPAYFSGHPSASCVSDPGAALGLQHDVEATPKSPDVLNNSAQQPPAGQAADAQLIIDATDARGRCHDQGDLGVSGAPLGGLEIVDITDLANPVELALTSHIGQSHTVNIDPRRPHIAYSVTSDSVAVTTDDNGTPDDVSDDTFSRANEQSGNGLDGFEVVDLSSCMAPPYGTLEVAEGLEGADLVAAKREQCQPETYRYRYPTVDMALGHTNEGNVYGCHELEIYPDDRLTCGAGGALIVLNMAGAFVADPETGLDKPNGTPLPCLPRPSSSLTNGTGATVFDCTVADEEGSQSLTVSGYPEGNDSLQGVEWIGTAYHMGRGAGTYDVNEDIDFNHEAEFTKSGKYLIATDERGGGVTPPGATCDAASLNLEGNGGVHAYQVDELKTERPVAATDAEEAALSFESYATGTDGKKAIFRTPVRTAASPSLCTAHVMQQIPGQNRIFMGWYSQGTQVIDYVELPNGQFEWVEDQAAQEQTEGSEDTPGTRGQAATTQAGYFIPEGANTWVSHVFKVDENEDGTFTYYGVSGEFITRNSIEVYKVTLPAPATACTLAPESTVEDRETAREVHRPSIDCVLHYDIAKGTSETTYSPTNDVTRAQMASFIANSIRAAGGTVPVGTGTTGFNDTAGSVHEENINGLAAAGIVNGKGDGSYDPDGKVTRDQMASFIVRAARFVTDQPYAASGTDNFSDVPATNVHRDNINAGFEADLFQGTTAPSEGTAGTYSPDLNVQRDQMATFLVRLFTQTIQP